MTGTSTGAMGRRAIVYGCTLAAYALSLAGPFQFDDMGVIVRYGAVHSLGSAWTAALRGIRPLLKLTYAANWALGEGAFGFHVVNLAVHLLCAELAMRLYVAASRRDEPWPFGRFDRGALVTGVVFAVHPVQTEAVTYVSGRSSSLSTLFVELALLTYAASARSPERKRAVAFLGWALLCFACAVLTKEITVVLPAGLLLWELVIERRRSGFFARQGAFAALFVAMSAAAIANTRYFELLYGVVGARSFVDAVRYQLVGVAYLVSRLVLVNRLSIDPGLGLHAPGAPEVVLAAGVFATLAAVAATELRRRPVVSFGVGWFLLQTFVPYVLLPRVDVVNERHMYVANVGLFMALASFATEVASRAMRPAVVRAVGGVTALALVLATVARNLDYESEVALWESTVRTSGNNPRVQNNLGAVYEAEGRPERARDAYARALAIEPRYTAARENLARVESRLQAARPP